MTSSNHAKRTFRALILRDRGSDMFADGRTDCVRALTRQGTKGMDREINVLALVKGDEKYIFLFNDANRTNTLRMLGRYAADPDLSFSWYDAAVLSQRIRDGVTAQPPVPPEPTHSRFRMGAAGEHYSQG